MNVCQNIWSERSFPHKSHSTFPFFYPALSFCWQALPELVSLLSLWPSQLCCKIRPQVLVVRVVSLRHRYLKCSVLKSSQGPDHSISQGRGSDKACLPASRSMKVTDIISQSESKCCTPSYLSAVGRTWKGWRGRRGRDRIAPPQCWGLNCWLLLSYPDNDSSLGQWWLSYGLWL